MMKARNGFIKDLHYFFLIGVIALGLMAIVGCGGGGGGTTVTVQDVGYVEGTVVDAITGHWLSGVTVKVGDRSDVTGDDGVYTITDLNVGSRIITATKNGYLPYSGTVLVRKGTTVTHSIQMSPEGADTTAPTVSSTSPGDGATEVPITSAITATFSEEMDASTISTDTFTVSTGVSDVIGTVTYSDTTATFTPSSSLSYSTTYIATITTGVGDIAGNSMSSDYSWSFTTESEPTVTPEAPTNVSAAPGDGEITISWDSASGATSYNIYMDTSSGVSKTSFTEKRTVTTTSYTWTTLTNGTTYYYVVTAENDYGEGGESEEVSATPGTPSAPENVTAIAGDGQVTISWDSVTGAASYNIYWSISSGVSKTDYEGILSDITTTSYTHTGLTNGTTYYYVVTAENDYGEGGESEEVNAMPSTPPSSPTWAKTYGGSGWDAANSIQQTTDGGYIVAGTTDSFGTGDWDVWVLKLDFDGTITWQKTYGMDGWDQAWSIQQTTDGGYIATGFVHPEDSSNIWVLKLYANGEIDWQKRYGGGSTLSNAYSSQQTTDSGYIVAGYMKVNAYEPNNFWVLKLNSEGDIIWQKTYGLNGNEGVRSIQQTVDGGYIMAGTTDSSTDIWILKINSNGDVIWQRTYDNSDCETVESIQQTTDGGYIVAGRTFCELDLDADIWVLKLNSEGDIIWQKTYGQNEDDWASSIQQTSDGGYIVAGKTSSFGAGGADIWVLKLNSDGDVIWQKTCGTNIHEYGRSVKQTSDGGYIVLGITAVGDIEVWVLKLNANGEIPYCSAMGESSAIVSDTSAIVRDTSVVPQDSSAVLDDTDVTPQDTLAEISVVCD